MEKKKADRKKIKNIQPIDEAKTNTDDITIVRNDNELIGAATTNRRIRLDPSYTSVTLPTHSYVSIAPIIEALRDCTTVEELFIPSRQWEQKELRDFIRCLSSANKGIKTIILRANDFNPHFIEALTKILKSNLQIKVLEISQQSTTISAEGFARFCDSMEYYHFEELIMMNTDIGVDSFKLLFESLKYNQSVKRLAIIRDPALAEQFHLLCDTLVSNPTITDLTCSGLGSVSKQMNAFKDVIRSNHLKKLELYDAVLAEGLAIIKEDLKANSSITDLTIFKSTVEWSEFGEIFRANSAIKRLDISGNIILPEEILHLSLGSNITLKELVLTNCELDFNYKTLFAALMNNKALTKLEIGKEYALELDLPSFEEFLKTNSTLIELKLHSNGLCFNDTIIKAMANGLKVNKSLRKLTFNKERYQLQALDLFIEAMKINTGVLELDVVELCWTYFENSNSPKSVESFYLDLLTVNKTIRYISGSAHFPSIEQRLIENRETQDKIIRDTCTFINMIVMKPSSCVLPVEIWHKIFEYDVYPWLPFDFSRYMNSVMNIT